MRWRRRHSCGSRNPAEDAVIPAKAGNRADHAVIPAEAGTQCFLNALDPRLRGNDGKCGDHGECGDDGKCGDHGECANVDVRRRAGMAMNERLM